MATHLYEDSLLCSYTPDVAGEIDGSRADLIERFAEVAQGWHGLPPVTRLGFEKAVVGVFIKSLESGLLDEAMEEGRAEAFSLAAVAMFQLLELVTNHERPDMLKACLGFAIGIDARSETEIGKEFGVHRATISKWCRRFIGVLHLVPSRGMRRPEAVEACRERTARVWEQRRAA